jgi:SAM-dependent methyltransferase
VSFGRSVGNRLRAAAKPGLRRLLRLAGRLYHTFDGGRSPAVGRGEAAETDNHLVSWYWTTQFEAMREDNSYWLNNRVVEESTYRLMTDTPDHWLTWLLNTYFKNRMFNRSLSLCCGDGAHEIQLYNSGQVRSVNGFDISEGAIEQAIKRFEDAGAPKDSYWFGVRDVNRLQLEGKFDLILSTGALHHTTNLEELLAKVEDLLEPTGYFVIVEFIGPNRFQWTDRQIEIANKILEVLDPYYLKNGHRVTFERPSIESMLRTDPSEAVRSAEVYTLVKKQFAARYERFYNGTLLHQLHPLLRSEFANHQRRDFDSIVRLLLLMEDLLVKNDVLRSDFAFLICQRRDQNLNQNLEQPA